MLMNKHFFSFLGLLFGFLIGLSHVSLAQDARTLLVVDLHGQAFYSADDMNQLQSVITPYRKQYGIAVQGFDKNLGGYVLFSSKTRMDQVSDSDLNRLKSSVQEVYPHATFTVKTQQQIIHKPKDQKIGSSEAGKNRNPKVQQSKR